MELCNIEMPLYLPLKNSILSTYDYMITKFSANFVFYNYLCVSKTLLLETRKLFLKIKFLIFCLYSSAMLQ